MILVEPISNGFEHATINAGLLQTALLAYPDEDVRFYSDKSHGESVKAMTETDLDRVLWYEMRVPPRHASGFRRAWRELRIMCVLQNFDAIWFCSATEIGLVMLKVLVVFRRNPVFVVLHGLLQPIVPGVRVKRFANWRGIRLIFRLPHPKALTYVVLSPVVKREMAKFTDAARYTVAIETPTLWRVKCT